MNLNASNSRMVKYFQSEIRNSRLLRRLSGEREGIDLQKIIYDFGANNGSDLPYYLERADVVVAVEANPHSCKAIAARFASQIEQGRLVIENVIVVGSDFASERSPFYLHKTAPSKSQLEEPKSLAEFDQIVMPCDTASSIVNRHGEPFYIKLDLEFFDGEVLRDLFSSGIIPPFISAESHSIDVFCLLHGVAGYSAFKLSDGHAVERLYDNKILTSDGKSCFRFPLGSSGPFGDDLRGPWYPADSFFRMLALNGIGWKDIHASNSPDVDSNPIRLQHLLIKKVRERLRGSRNLR